MRPAWVVIAAAFTALVAPGRAQVAAPPVPTADRLLTAAIARAKAEQKAVWVDFSASWCGPCQRLLGVFHAPVVKSIIDRHFVLLTLTVMEEEKLAKLNNPGADALMKRWGGGGGIPFYVFLDDTGGVIASSNVTPDGSAIGYPNYVTDIRHFMGMIDRGAPHLPAGDRSILTEYLLDHGDGLGSIAGAVSLPGSPVPAASVILASRAYQNGRWVFLPLKRRDTDATGRFLFDHLDPGDYRVVIDTAAASLTFFPGVVSSTSARTIELGRNQELTNIDVALKPAAAVAVTGVVHDANGSVLSGAPVTLTDMNWPANQFTSATDATGKFQFDKVRSGAYALTATPRSEKRRAIETGRLEITVGDRDMPSLGLTVGPAATVKGTVRVEGTPLTPIQRSALRVTAIAAGGSVATSSQLLTSPVGADGRFAVSGITGKHVIRVDDLPPGWFMSAVRRGSIDITDEPTDATAGNGDTVEIVLSSGAAAVTGTVQSANGRLARGGAVIIFAADSSRWTYPSRFVRIGPVDDQGRFAVRSLPPGNYAVVAVPLMPPAWNAPESLERLRAVSLSIALAAGDRKTVSLKQAR